MTKVALIIGVSGQDGALLAKFLLDKGYKVIGTSRDHEVCLFSNLERLGIRNQVVTDSMVTSDFRSVITILSRYEPDEIYNLAGQTSVGMSFDYPVETFDSILAGTMNLLECVRMINKNMKLYSAGSSEVFGNTFEGAREDTAFSPRSPYATAKAAASFAVNNYREAYGLFACTGILFNHESCLRPKRFVTKKIVAAAEQIANGAEMTLSLGNISVIRDWGWAPEYVEAMWLMVQASDPQDFLICTGQPHSLQDFVQEVFDYFGLDWRDHTSTDDSLLRPLDVDINFGCPDKASALLQWNARTRFKELVLRLCTHSL